MVATNNGGMLFKCGWIDDRLGSHFINIRDPSATGWAVWYLRFVGSARHGATGVGCGTRHETVVIRWWRSDRDLPNMALPKTCGSSITGPSSQQLWRFKSERGPQWCLHFLNTLVTSLIGWDQSAKQSNSVKRHYGWPQWRLALQMAWRPRLAPLPSICPEYQPIHVQWLHCFNLPLLLGKPSLLVHIMAQQHMVSLLPIWRVGYSHTSRIRFHLKFLKILLHCKICYFWDMGKLYNSSQDHDEKKVGLYYNTGRQCGAKFFENCNDSSTELHLDGVRSYPPVMDIHGLLRSLGEMREPLQSRGYHSRDISWY